jgi:hypothetical protein
MGTEIVVHVNESMDHPAGADAEDGVSVEVDDQEAVGMNNNEVPEWRRIQDFETWLSNNALRGRSSSSSSNDDNNEASQSLTRGWTADRREALERIQEHERYQQELHERFFGENKGDNAAFSSSATAAEQDRLETLRRFESQRFSFLARASISDENHRGDNNNPASPTNATTRLSKSHVDETTVVLEVPLRPVAESCETVFVAASRHSCTQLSLVSDGSVRELYPESAVAHVLRVMLDEATVDETPDHHAVDCCRLAHYLQHSGLVDAYASILGRSVDSENCLSLLQLAEQLRLPSLWEKSLQQVLDTMDQVPVDAEGDDSNSNRQPDDFMTSELRDRIVAIQTAIRSSVHGPCGSARPSTPLKDRATLPPPSDSEQRPSPSSRLFFSSVEEYVSIFAERVQYFRERLADAKAQRDELLGGGGTSANGTDSQLGAAGRFVSTRRDRFFEVPGGLSRQYADDLQRKIERQERRVRTLEIALKEHKKLLLGGSYLRDASSSGRPAER